MVTNKEPCPVLDNFPLLVHQHEVNALNLNWNRCLLADELFILTLTSTLAVKGSALKVGLNFGAWSGYSDRTYFNLTC